MERLLNTLACILIHHCLALTFSFKQDISVLFLHNSYGTPELSDCENLVGEDQIENLRQANTEPSMHFRETNMDPSMHFRKANTDLSMHFRKANKEIQLAPSFTPNFTHNFSSNLTSVFTVTFNPNIPIKLFHHNECNVIYFRTQFSFLQQSNQLTVPSQWNLQEKTNTSECLYQAVTNPSTNIA